MHQYLKIKVVSLADEARRIRHDQNKRLFEAARARVDDKPERTEYHVKNYSGLHHHRVEVVRREARAANLAYAFVHGYAYGDVERFAWEEPDWNKIMKLVARYGEDDERMEKFKAWVAGAQLDFIVRLMKRKAEIEQKKLEKAAESE